MPKNIEFQAKQTSNDSHDNLYEATVYTWGVKVRGASKLKHQVGVKLFGGNVGHASIGLLFPANQATDKLVENYLEHDNFMLKVPYEKISRNITIDGKIKKLYFYQVYFSVWESPDYEQQPIYLCRTLLEDSIAARARKNYNFKRNAPDYADIEYRNIKGLLRKKRITLPPMLAIITPGDNNPNAKEIQQILKKFTKIYNDIIKNKDEIYLLKLSKNKNLSDAIEEKEAMVANLEYEFEQLYETNKNLNLDRYIKIGEAPDGKICLPVINSENTKFTNGSGLELENMLKTMRTIIDDKGHFNFNKKNCSSTTLTILNSGILDKDRKWMAKHVPKVAKYLDKSAWLFKMLTPQSVYNAAYDMEKRIMRRKRITQPIKGLIKPGPVKNFISQLKIFKNLLLSINRDKYHKLTDTTDTGLEEQHLFFGFNNPLKTTKDQPTDTKTQKPSNQRDFR